MRSLSYTPDCQSSVRPSVQSVRLRQPKGPSHFPPCNPVTYISFPSFVCVYLSLCACPFVPPSRLISPVSPACGGGDGLGRAPGRGGRRRQRREKKGRMRGSKGMRERESEKMGEIYRSSYSQLQFVPYPKIRSTLSQRSTSPLKMMKRDTKPLSRKTKRKKKNVLVSRED